MGTGLAGAEETWAGLPPPVAVCSAGATQIQAPPPPGVNPSQAVGARQWTAECACRVGMMAVSGIGIFT